MAITSERNDPSLNFNFSVHIDGLDTTGFCHIDGLGSSVDIRRRGFGRFYRRVPGQIKYQNIVLRRGFDRSLGLWNWYQRTLSGRVDRRDGLLVLLNEEREPIMQFQLRKAWPCRWQLSPFDALHPDILIEEIELVIESFNIAT